MNRFPPISRLALSAAGLLLVAVTATAQTAQPAPAAPNAPAAAATRIHEADQAFITDGTKTVSTQHDAARIADSRTSGRVSHPASTSGSATVSIGAAACNRPAAGSGCRSSRIAQYFGGTVQFGAGIGGRGLGVVITLPSAGAGEPSPAGEPGGPPSRAIPRA